MSNPDNSLPPAAQDFEPDSVLFAASLKSYNSDLVVIGFDSTTLKSKTTSASPEFDPSLDLDVNVIELFKEGEWWESRTLLHDSLKLFGKIHGWVPTLKSDAIRCNRFGQSTTARNYKSGPLAVSCTFQLRLATKYHVMKRSDNPKDPNNNPLKPRNDWERETRITSANYDHGGGCRPSTQNLVMAQERCGQYFKSITSSKMFTLCSMMENGKLSSSSVKRVIRPIWPKKKKIKAQDVFNIKKKVLKMLPTLRANPDYEQFCAVVNDSMLLDGIDNDGDIDDDQAHLLARDDMWLEVLQSGADDDDSIINLVEYLDLISANAKGFVYEMAVDNEGKVNGVMWQTATMRDNFEKFGGYVSLDTMKRAINKWLWPYMAITMYNELNQMCLGCEGIMCGEREDAYRFMCAFVLKYSPGRLAVDVYAVAGDGFFSQQMIEDFGFIAAKFIMD